MTIPCGTCRACCIGQAVFLQPGDGDPRSFEVEFAVNPLTGHKEPMLAHKPNAECIYLSASGCSIYNRRPAVCRTYDCGDEYTLKTPRERRELSTSRSGAKIMTSGRRIAQWREARARGENPPPPFGERSVT